jgi:hypothetical protein
MPDKVLALAATPRADAMRFPRPMSCTDPVALLHAERAWSSDLRAQLIRRDEQVEALQRAQHIRFVKKFADGDTPLAVVFAFCEGLMERGDRVTLEISGPDSFGQFALDISIATNIPSAA